MAAGAGALLALVASVLWVPSRPGMRLRVEDIEPADLRWLRSEAASAITGADSYSEPEWGELRLRFLTGR